jgi:hypothetical protein
MWGGVSSAARFSNGASDLSPFQDIWSFLSRNERMSDSRRLRIFFSSLVLSYIAIITSASMHDSGAAIPLMRLAVQRKVRRQIIYAENTIARIG